MNFNKTKQFQNLRNFRPGKTWVILGVALAIGALAALAARSYLNNQMAAIEAHSKGKMVTVLVAKSDIAKGAKLSRENVALRPIPIEFSHSVAVTPDDFDRINGQLLAYPVKSGEMILWGLMETQKVPTFSARVETGHRAMTVPVDEINSISGMVEPGDTIDLIVSLERKGKKYTFPLMQNAQVMATGQRSVDDPKSGERRQFSTVTIDTTPEQAEHVIVAREVGKLTALLRNPQDKQTFGNPKLDVATLLGLKDAPGKDGKGDKGIPVIYGGPALANLAPEALRLAQAVHARAGDDAGAAAPPIPVLRAPPVTPANPANPAAAPSMPLIPGGAPRGAQP